MCRRSSSPARSAERVPARARSLVLAGALLSAFAGSAAPAAAASRWSSAPQLRHARAAHAVVSTGDALVALGGTGAGGRPVAAVEVFDGHVWREIGALPVPGLNAPAAVALGRRVYLIGGFDLASNRPSDRVHLLDLDSGRWREVAPLPAPRGGHAAAVLDGHIHVVGGGNDVATIARHDVYDPAADRWTALAPLPRAEGSPALVVQGGRLLAIGGRSGAQDFGDVYVYEPALDRWRSGPSIPPRGTAGAALACGRVLVFGGESQARGASLAEVWRLDGDAEAGRWVADEPMPTARNFARAVRLGDAVYVVGGDPQAGNSHAGAGSAVVERRLDDCAG